MKALTAIIVMFVATMLLRVFGLDEDEHDGEE